MLSMTIQGRIGRDAELRETDNSSVLDITVACNYGMKGSDGKKPTQWVKATMWGRQAEALEQYLTKGKGVSITLRDVHVRTYDKNDGTVGHSLQGTVVDFEFTGAGPREEGDAPQRSARRDPEPPPPKKPPPNDDWDDDIPF